MGKKTWFVILAVLVIIVGGVTYANASKKASTNTITIGSVTSDADIWRHLATSDAAKRLKLNIKVKEFTDGKTIVKFIVVPKKIINIVVK